MKPPRWLEELHRQWQHARGTRTDLSSSAFSRDWEDLLDAAGLRSAEDRAHAAREAAALEAGGRLVLKRHTYRRHIQRIRVPVAHELWLCGLFHAVAPAALLQRSIDILCRHLDASHPLYPDLWQQLCQAIILTFEKGKSLRPFRRLQPEALDALLSLTRSLTAREWPPHTLVRSASIALGFDSKALERYQHAARSALTLFFQRNTSLEALGIITANSLLTFHGPLELHFPGGETQAVTHLAHQCAVTAADLERARLLTTTASQLLTVENTKTTFRHFVTANAAADRLVVATSFPTTAVTRLLVGLPAALPHYHFGDTDPAGYFILQKLREASPRPVTPWQMDWRDHAGSPLLSLYDRRVIARLLAAENMADTHADLRRMLASGRKGDYEQETRAPAALPE